MQSIDDLAGRVLALVAGFHKKHESAPTAIGLTQDDEAALLLHFWKQQGLNRPPPDIRAEFKRFHGLLILWDQLETHVRELSDEEKQELCIEHLVNKGVTVKELLTELTRNLIKWYTYLYTYEKAEAYELCAKIKQVIDLEIKDFLFNLSVYGEEIGDYVQVIDELNEKIQKKLWPNY